MSKSSSKNSRPAPVSVRLNSVELEALQRRAGGIPLSTYMKQAALGPDGPAAGRGSRAPKADHVVIAQVLARLGQAGLADSLRRLARQADDGTLYLGEETRDRLLEACEDVRAMRVLLLKALGKEILQEAGRGSGAVSAIFGTATAGRPAP